MVYLIVLISEIADSELPFGFFRNPFHLFNFLPESKVSVNIILIRYILPISPNFGALGKLFGPLGVWRKSGLIRVGGNVTSNAGICILEPVNHTNVSLPGKGRVFKGIRTDHVPPCEFESVMIIARKNILHGKLYVRRRGFYHICEGPNRAT